MSKNENIIQADLIEEIKERLPGCEVLKNDANYIQGIPDLTVFYGSKYAILECKKASDSRYRPNQEYYLSYFHNMGGFAARIEPENKDEVLNQMCEYLMA